MLERQRCKPDTYHTSIVGFFFTYKMWFSYNCQTAESSITVDMIPMFECLKEKLPQAFMQIECMENDFRNLTAKVWANLDNPIKSYDFSKFWWHSANICDVTTVQLSNGTVYKFHKMYTFHENASSLYFYT